MAQSVMQYLVDKRGLSGIFEIDSAATTTEEIGNGMYRPVRKKLASEGIPVADHRARQISRREGNEWDYIVYMDSENEWHLSRILPRDHTARVCSLLSFAGRDDDVADPWYSGDFDAAFDDILEGCQALLEEILEEM